MDIVFCIVWKACNIRRKILRLEFMHSKFSHKYTDRPPQEFFLFIQSIYIYYTFIDRLAWNSKRIYLPSLLRDLPLHFFSLSFFEFNDVVGLFCDKIFFGDVKQLLFSDSSFSNDVVALFCANGGDMPAFELIVELVAAQADVAAALIVDPMPRRIDADENVCANC